MNRSVVGGLCMLAMTLGLGAGVAPGDCVVDEDCDDVNVCTYDECTGGMCSNSPRLYGDVDGDGTPNVFDVFCILDLIAGEPVGPECDPVNANIEPCVPNEALNAFDIFAVLEMIAGEDPCCYVREEMVLIPAGQFLMGDHHGDGFSDELPVHVVNLSAFYVNVYEVTSRQYADALNWAYGQGLIEDPDAHEGVVRGSWYVPEYEYEYCDTTASSSGGRITWDGSTFGVAPGKEDHPMVKVSWWGAAAYANWRSAREGRTPSYDVVFWECDFDTDGYRLPTEAEYAARGGEHGPYYRYPWGDAVEGSKANYSESGDLYETGPHPWTTPADYYNGHQTPAGSDMANGYGLYGMAGNVREFCNDWYDPAYYSSSPPDDPRGPASGEIRVLRGGSWDDYDGRMRCADRAGRHPDYRSSARDTCGFRLALDVE